MKNSTMHRSNLSGESMALLAELKAQNTEADTDREEVRNEEEHKSHGSKQQELDYLWQNFKINPKEEKSPGIYILAGFIAGALSMFLMTAMLSITSFSDINSSSPSQERKLIKKEHGSFAPTQTQTTDINAIPLTPEEAEIVSTPAVYNEKYTVKAGDSLEAISVKYYGQSSPENTAKIQQANELSSPHSIYAGQELLIPMN